MILFCCLFSSEFWPKKTKSLNVNKNDFGAYLTRSDDSFDATFTSPVDAIIDFTIPSLWFFVFFDQRLFPRFVLKKFTTMSRIRKFCHVDIWQE